MPDARAIIVPRWAGRPGSDWYPWIAAELAAQDAPIAVTCLDLPDPDCPEIERWAADIAQAIAASARRGAGQTEAETAPAAADCATLLAGHSVGCQAILHALAALRGGASVAGTLLVAGWWDLDAPWETIQPWLDRAPGGAALARARAAAGRVRVLISDDDPFTGDWQRTRRQWQDRMGAAVVVEPGGKHFNGTSEPAVLRELLALRDRVTGA